jgi:hypothetical protein
MILTPTPEKINEKRFNIGDCTCRSFEEGECIDR